MEVCWYVYCRQRGKTIYIFRTLEIKKKFVQSVAAIEECSPLKNHTFDGSDHGAHNHDHSAHEHDHSDHSDHQSYPTDNVTDKSEVK